VVFLLIILQGFGSKGQNFTASAWRYPTGESGWSISAIFREPFFHLTAQN